MKIAICGSMSFAQEMLEAQSGLQELGYTAIIPIGTEQYANTELSVEDKWTKIENDVIKEWYEIIKDSDAILVVNKTKNNIENYVGGNALIEMAFAHVLNKKVFLLNPIPKGMNYTDEIESFQPVILNGDLNKISSHSDQ